MRDTAWSNSPYDHANTRLSGRSKNRNGASAVRSTARRQAPVKVCTRERRAQIRVALCPQTELAGLKVRHYAIRDHPPGEAQEFMDGTIVSQLDVETTVRLAVHVEGCHSAKPSLSRGATKKCCERWTGVRDAFAMLGIASEAAATSGRLNSMGARSVRRER